MSAPLGRHAPAHDVVMVTGSAAGVNGLSARVSEPDVS